MVPVEKNRLYTIEITDLASDGNGVGRVEGFAVFIPATAPGDVVKTLIVKVNRSCAYGRAEEIIKPSPLRRKAECPVYRRCGGCQLSHILYAEQLRLKKRFIEDAMQRLGGFKGLCAEEIIGMEEPRRYRNKMVFPIGKDDEGRTVCGFYAPRSHRIIPLEDCLLGAEASSRVMRAVIAYMEESGVLPYDEESHTGLVRRIFVRTARATGQLMAVISINGDSLPRPELLVRKLDFADSVILNINKKRTNLVLGDKNVTLAGRGYIEDVLMGLRFEISPNSFFQVNPVQTEKLYEKALEYAQLSGKERVMDVYCGIGTISLCAAKNARSVIGVEVVERAVRDAVKNAERNGIDNVRFFDADASELVPKLIAEGEAPDVVILDPPRKGSDERTLEAIAAAAPERIVYVSCNPATLARDAAYLKQRGYAPVRMCGVDMFPDTVHVETIVLLQRRNT